MNTRTLDRVEHKIRTLIDDGRVLGLALVVLEGDCVVYTGAFGRTSVELEGVPVTPETLFDIGSIAKTLCATLVMRLVERGLLDLDRPVVEYLPGFAFRDALFGKRVTLRHVLSHTSGLPASGKGWGPRGRDALERFVWEQLAHYGFIAEPGRVHQYASAAFCLAGYVTEAVTGTAYRDLVREHVLDPLGMERTTYDHAVAMTYRLALPHEEDEDGMVQTLHRWVENASGEPSAFAMAPATDLARLALVLLNDGRGQNGFFLSAESIQAMQQAHGDRHVGGASHPIAHLYERYGLGLQLGTYRGARIVRHGGVSQSFNCFLHLLPGVGAGFVLLTNYGDEDAVADVVFSLHDALLGLPEGDAAPRAVLVPALEAPVDRELWLTYQGTYLNVQRRCLATVSVREDKLTLRLGEAADVAHELVPIASGQFFYEEEGLRTPVAFLAGDGVGADRQVAAEHAMIGGNPYRRFIAHENPQSDPAAMAGLCGEYRDPSNAGEGAVWRLSMKDGRLWLSGEWGDGACEPIGPRSFRSGIGLLEFDEAGQVFQVAKATRYFRVPDRP